MFNNFEKLPYVAKQLAYSVGGIRNGIYRYGPEYFKFRKFLKKSEKWDNDQKKEWQKNELKYLLKEVQKYSPYYKENWNRAIERALEEESISDIINELPVLKKKELRSQTDKFYNSKRRGILRQTTSGSTGSPLSVKFDWKSIQRRQAIQDDHLERCGISPKAKSIRLSGHYIVPTSEIAQKPWVYNPVERQLFLSTYHLNSQHADQISKKVQEYRPVLIDGYPSAVLQLLQICRNKNNKLDALKLVVTTAETLDDNTRAKIENLSKVPVCDYYAASEGVPYIQQCLEGTYHVRWQTGIFEMQEAPDTVKATGFAQFKTPLIRYDTGDVLSGISQESDCKCGLSGTTVKNILGRVQDFVLTEDGRSIAEFVHHTLKHIKGLDESQVIQKDYKRFKVNCVLTANADKGYIYEEMKKSFKRVLGTDVDIELEFLTSIPRGPNGKIRLVISEIH